MASTEPSARAQAEGSAECPTLSLVEWVDFCVQGQSYHMLEKIVLKKLLKKLFDLRYISTEKHDYLFCKLWLT
jgi:hypothetical protein